MPHQHIPCDAWFQEKCLQSLSGENAQTRSSVNLGVEKNKRENLFLFS